MKTQTNIFIQEKNMYIKCLFYLLLIIFLRPDLILINNTPTGGDMGAHVVAVDFFTKNFFPNAKIFGWSNIWFAGFPLYYFYFPIPAIFVSLLLILFPFGIAFKLMVSFSIVLVVYSFEKLFRDRNENFNLLGYLCGLIFVLTESFTIYGGNLASTLAGQYSFTYSLAFGLLAYNYCEKEDDTSSHIKASVFLALCLLSHLIPFILFSVIVFSKTITSRLSVAKKLIFFSTFISLVSLWFIPMISNLSYTTDMGYTPFTNLSDLIKADVYPFIILCFIFSILCYRQLVSNSKIFFLSAYMFVLSTVLFFFIPPGALWNGRLIPFFNLGIIIFFGLVLKIIFQKVNASDNYLRLFIAVGSLSIGFYLSNYFILWNSKFSLTTYFFLFVVVVTYFMLSLKESLNSMILLLLTVGVFSTITYLPHWINWNFTGYEGKENWKDVTQLYDKLSELPPGRITWEASPDLNEYGTPMVLMTIPMFTDHTSMEGLYFDSSITTPFHFISVSGLSEQPSNPVGGLRYYNGQFERGVYYLKQLGVDYFITYSDTKFQEALNSRNLDFIDRVSKFGIFSVNESFLVETINKNIEIVRTPDGLSNILSSLLRENNDNKFVERALTNFYDLQSSTRIIEVNNNEDIRKFEPSIEKNYLENVVVESGKISFSTEYVGEPHLIKVSYFPNWKIVNGEGPFRVDPSFMMVIPDRSNVEIIFTVTRIEIISRMIFLTFLFASMFLINYSKRDINVE